MRNVLALTLAALLLAPAHARDHTDFDEKGAEKLDLLRKYPENSQSPNEIRKPHPKKR